jgi:hypothetical protein
MEMESSEESSSDDSSFGSHEEEEVESGDTSPDEDEPLEKTPNMVIINNMYFKEDTHNSYGKPSQFSIHYYCDELLLKYGFTLQHME